ncbi:MAG: CPBP family intramembrane metalloprotease [Clostridia bacterium]|nr:CPBP family intramembrane metalloprotease [Clostridia bacterium]
MSENANPQQTGLLTEEISARILRDMENGVIVIGPKGTIIEINDSASKMFETTAEEAKSISVLMKKHRDKKNDTLFQCMMDAIYQQETVHQKKAPFVTAAGKAYSLHVTSSFLKGSDTKGVVITISDETVADNLEIKRHDSMLVLLSVIVILGLFIFTQALINFIGNPVPSQFYSRFAEIVSVIALVMYLKFTSFTVKEMGLKSSNLKRDLLEAVGISAVIVAVLAIAKVITIALGSTYFSKETAFFSWEDRPAYLLEYVLIALYQEFLARCALQANLQRILGSKGAGGVVAILIASLIFGCLHMHYGLMYMIGASILMGSLGLIYRRQKNIWGTFIVHYVFGIAGKFLHWI